MKPQDLDALARKLRRSRDRLFKEVADTEADLEFFSTDRESEIEERAQDDRAARLLVRLDERGKRAIEEIDAALQRMRDDTYGRCARCARPIPLARLKALPATRFCLACARDHERSAMFAIPTEPPRTGTVPPDLTLLGDRDTEVALRELVSDDERLDHEELRLVCRHGVVYLDGALPSTGQHHILRHLITDVVGMREVVDRIQVKEMLWERDDRSKEPHEAPPPPWLDEPATEDVVRSLEEGVTYVPPVAPIPEEED